MTACHAETGHNTAQNDLIEQANIAALLGNPTDKPFGNHN